ncbi:hypothetical protein [Asanoa siamensis]|uniref:Uncharacterized protein n=1 Tax=Asanoa siamensis TaxID=926357 RepID=A0ABQ4CM90_9ACTN|nr:hypothetical protein [Asanoa siamensis]GIF72416.1 hypothetical protein Asi02nite_19340 [Asanoa siamensis]
MANNSWDAAIKQLYPADNGTKDFAETVARGKPFDVVAAIEIGRNLREFVTSDLLTVTVTNRTRMTVVAQVTAPRTLAPASAALAEDLRVDINGGWDAKAGEGDVLEAVATYKTVAGVHTDYSSATSQLFTVVA